MGSSHEKTNFLAMSSSIVILSDNSNGFSLYKALCGKNTFYHNGSINSHKNQQAKGLKYGFAIRPDSMGNFSGRHGWPNPKIQGGVMKILILLAVIIAFVTIFSVQNASPVAISFIFWKFEASLAIVIFLCLLCGVIIGSALMYVFKSRAKNKG